MEEQSNKLTYDDKMKTNSDGTTEVETVIQKIQLVNANAR